jgi:CheY-like chemotaxis protein
MEGSRWFAEESFDAVLLDICMPPAPDMEPDAVQHGRETGIEVARRFHAQKPTVPIVALTVVYDEEIKTRMRDAGIREIINKPTDPGPIGDTMLRVVRGATVETGS